MLGQGPAWNFWLYPRGMSQAAGSTLGAAELWGGPPLVTDSGVRHSRNLYSATNPATFGSSLSLNRRGGSSTFEHCRRHAVLCLRLH